MPNRSRRVVTIVGAFSLLAAAFAWLEGCATDLTLELRVAAIEVRDIALDLLDRLLSPASWFEWPVDGLDDGGSLEPASVHQLAPPNCEAEWVRVGMHLAAA